MTITPAAFQLAALWFLYDLAAHSLVRITADYDDATLSVQIVMLNSATEDEVENLRCFATELLAQFYDVQLNEDFIYVGSAPDAAKIKDLPLKIFAVHGAKYSGESQ